MMKKITLGLLALGAVVLGGCGITTNAVDYNNALVDLTDPLYETYNNYSIYAEETSLQYATKIEERRQETVNALQNLRGELADYDDYKGDDSLKEGFLSNLDDILSVLENEDKGLVAIWIEINDIPNDDWNEALEASYTEQENGLLESANTKLETSGAKLTSVQEAFAEKHGFELVTE